MAEPNNPEGGDQPKDSYFVWAIRPTDLKDRLKSLMSSLRSEFGSPAFDPHIIIVDDLRLRRNEAITRFHFPVATLKPYTDRIFGVAYGSFFYHRVYLLIDPCRRRRGGGGRALDLGEVLSRVTSRLNLHLGATLLTMFTTERTFGRKSTKEDKEASAK